MISFFLMFNKRGQIRFSKYFNEKLDATVKSGFQASIIKLCLTQYEGDNFCLSHEGYRIVYRKHSHIYCVMGLDDEENELACLEVMRLILETLNKQFSQMSELDLLFNLDQVHMVVDEILLNGHIVETNTNRILMPVRLLNDSIRR